MPTTSENEVFIMCIRSLNVALRQQLDLYVCLRPVRWFEGVPSPVKKPGDGSCRLGSDQAE